MIVEGLAVAALAKTLYQTNKSMKMDEKALKKYAKAFERSEEAELLVKKKAEYTDKRLANVAKKKRAIIEVTVPMFVEVYEQIQKINLKGTAKVNEITIQKKLEKVNVLNTMSLSVKQNFSDKELVCGLLTKSIGKLMMMDSERYLSAANNQMRSANVVYSQSESIAAIYDAVVERADRIAKLLMSMNALFTKSIQETKETIERNGIDVKNYSEYDKSVLMTCVNFAVALYDIIDVPVVDEKGQICQEAEKLIVSGEKYLKQMNQVINS